MIGQSGRPSDLSWSCARKLMSTMASGLSSEFSKFSRKAKQLKQILLDTKRCFQEINTAGKFESGPPLVAELSDIEEEEIESVVRRPPCIVIFGQTLYAKAHVVNELFNKVILPLVEVNDRDVRWRMVRFKHGEQNNISLALPGSYELVDHLAAYNRPWQTIPNEDLEVESSLSQSPNNDLAKGLACLEVRLPLALLKECQVVVGPWNTWTVEEVYKESTDGVMPILVYAISKDILSDEDIRNLKDLSEVSRGQPVLFIKVPPPIQFELKQTLIPKTQPAPIRTIQNAIERHSLNDRGCAGNDLSPVLTIFQQLMDIGYLNLLSESSSTAPDTDSYRVESDLIDKFANFSNMVGFTRKVLRSYLVRTTNLLNVVHNRCLKTFIETAFDMQRDMIITPRRIEFARQKETELYAMLMEMAINKQDEIRKIIAETIADMRDDLLHDAERYEFQGVHLEDSVEGAVLSPRDLKSCSAQIQELVLGSLNTAIASKLLGSVNVLKDSYTGVLTRCLESLEQSDRENIDSVRTSMILREILNAAYRVEITVRAGSSLIKVLLEKMKQLMASVLWTPPPRVNREWKRKVADDMLNSLSETRLAKSICTQIKDRLKHSHDHFSSALRQLEARHSGRLERTEEQRLKVRKIHAPKVARLALESISLRDYVLFGMPQMGREVGRGQYGVVYSCDQWAGYSPCAIKSVVPPDDKHWNDLALEFYYTKNVPEHERLVALRGSVIDYSYGGGCSPAVLLIMERLQKDLYTAIKFNLDWISRLQVAIDVVEGIRFLHSQGLVHRDIKLKNVLLDRKNRGKITDLGFCKPEAMMSGSIVGTPIHMAPELFSGRYDNSVDVYAFGILFWYVCAGHVKLPYNFEQCTTKDMLWTSVKRGVRPEKLSVFDQDCWEIMSACWQGKPEKRPLLGVVEPKLEEIMKHYKSQVPLETLLPHRPRHRERSTRCAETDTARATTTMEVG